MNILIKQFHFIISSLDEQILKLSKKCLKATFYFSIFATLFLITYKFYSAPSLFIIGATLLKYGLIYCICIATFSLAFSKIKDDI